MLNITLHPVEDIHSMYAAQSRELIMIGGADVRNADFPHRVVQSWQQRPELAPHSRCQAASEIRRADVQVPGKIGAYERVMVDGQEYAVILNPYGFPALEPVRTPPDNTAIVRADADGVAWRALAALKPGDNLTVDMDTATVAVTVDRVLADGARTEDASVICRFPRTGTRIEITHEDMVTGARPFRRGWGPDAGTIRRAAFVG